MRLTLLSTLCIFLLSGCMVQTVEVCPNWFQPLELSQASLESLQPEEARSLLEQHCLHILECQQEAVPEFCS